jgi:hypothetical protein
VHPGLRFVDSNRAPARLSGSGRLRLGALFPVTLQKRLKKSGSRSHQAIRSERVLGAPVGYLVEAGVSPSVEHGLDEALGFAVCAGRLGLERSAGTRRAHTCCRTGSTSSVTPELTKTWRELPVEKEYGLESNDGTNRPSRISSAAASSSSSTRSCSGLDTRQAPVCFSIAETLTTNTRPPEGKEHDICVGVALPPAGRPLREVCVSSNGDGNNRRVVAGSAELVDRPHRITMRAGHRSRGERLGVVRDDMP